MKSHVGQFLVGARRLLVTVGTAHGLHVIAVGAVALDTRTVQTSASARTIGALFRHEPGAVVHFGDYVVVVFVITTFAATINRQKRQLFLHVGGVIFLKIIIILL